MNYFCLFYLMYLYFFWLILIYSLLSLIYTFLYIFTSDLYFMFIIPLWKLINKYIKITFDKTTKHLSWLVANCRSYTSQWLWLWEKKCILNPYIVYIHRYCFWYIIIITKFPYEIVSINKNFRYLFPVINKQPIKTHTLKDWKITLKDFK